MCTDWWSRIYFNSKAIMAKDRHLNSELKIGSYICLFVFHEKQTNRFCQRIPYEYSQNENNLFTFLDHSHINFDSEYRHKLTSSMCFIAYYRKAQWNGNIFFSFCICIFCLCIYIFFLSFFLFDSVFCCFSVQNAVWNLVLPDRIQTFTQN